MSIFKNISILLLFMLCMNVKASDIISYSILDDNTTLTQQNFVEHINQIVIVQPEYLHATAKYYELDQNKKYAQRLRFPTLEAQIVNDRSIKRDINTGDALRKIRDDSFDGVIRIDQPLYKGNEINSRVKLAKSDISYSDIDRKEIASDLIINASDIYLNAANSVLVSDYSKKLLDKMLKYRETAKARFNAGAIENSELALINIRISEIEVKQALLDADKTQMLSIYLSFFRDDYNGLGLPLFQMLDTNEEDLINFKDNSYQQLKSEIDVNKAKHNLEITKSQYRPQLGFSMRYTQYDIDEDAEDNDLRGGIYFSLPLFNFGRGTAQINAGKAKINQAKIYRDQTTRDSENINAQIFGAFYGSLQARNRILESYNNVKLQRETFEIRMVGSSFAIPALLEAVAKEISLYEQLVNNEKKLLMADLNRRHLNRQLLNRFYISF